jgi:hypothetical protein
MNLVQAAFRLAPDRERYEDFARRYDEGHPADGYADEEVLHCYDQVSELLSPSAYCEVAKEAFARLAPPERRQFYTAFLTRTRHHLGRPLARHRKLVDEPTELARLAADLQRRKPGTLGRVLSDELRSMRSLDRATKATLAGITALGITRMLMPSASD